MKKEKGLIMAFDTSDVIGFIGKLDEKNDAMKVVRNNSILTVGRHGTCDVSPPDDKKISRNHGTLEATNAVVSWRIYRTKNGTFINDMLVDDGQLVHLWDGDKITIGNTVLTFMERRKMPVDRNATERK